MIEGAKILAERIEARRIDSEAARSASEPNDKQPRTPEPDGGVVIDPLDPRRGAPGVPD